MNTDTVQWIIATILTAAMAFLAFRKLPAEKMGLNGSASKSYAEAAQIAGELSRKYALEVQELETRLDILEKKKYRISIEFTLGDPPTVGIVSIEPFVSP